MSNLTLQEKLLIKHYMIKVELYTHCLLEKISAVTCFPPGLHVEYSSHEVTKKKIINQKLHCSGKCSFGKCSHTHTYNIVALEVMGKYI